MLFHLCLFALAVLSVTAQPLYFPAANSDASWARLSSAELGWCQDKLDSLVSFASRSDTRALIILKDGKIALEQYFGSFTKDSLWYWASAGKTVTAALVGIAQHQKQMDISKSSATYLGRSWSSCTPQQEDAITVRHHLTMTTGIGFDRGNDNCKTPECLRYRAVPGTIWDYHNACYLLLQDMIEKATNRTFQQYYNQQLSQKLGMGGLWFNGILFSRPLAMARFGLMLLAGGVWNGDTIIKDREYFNAMINTSQQLNRSYGYLFWLNGKASFMQPGIPLVFQNDLVPSAPKDMYAGMGKNDQRVYVVPSQRMVVVRMGDPGDTSAPAISGYDDALWRYINALPCNTSVGEPTSQTTSVWPNPATTVVSFLGDSAVLYDVLGNEVLWSNTSPLDVSRLPSGTYQVVVTQGTSRVGSPLIIR